MSRGLAPRPTFVWITGGHRRARRRVVVRPGSRRTARKSPRRQRPLPLLAAVAAMRARRLCTDATARLASGSSFHAVIWILTLFPFTCRSGKLVTPWSRMHVGNLSAFEVVKALCEDPLEPELDGLPETPQAASRTAVRAARTVSEGRCIRRSACIGGQGRSAVRACFPVPLIRACGSPAARRSICCVMA